MIEFSARLRRGSFQFDAAFKSEARLLALHGASGAGKSTAAMIVAGLARPDEGRIVLNDAVLLDTRAGLSAPPERRRIGVVFQDALLFPHLTVRQNILFGRFFSRRDAPRLDVDTVVDTLGVGALMDRRPANLSGGERQRVGIARALLAGPRLLLLDEPMASLDHPRRQEIMRLIERVRDEFDIPILLISHSAEEIARLADEVVVFDHGRVVARGSPSSTLPGASRLVEGGRFQLSSTLAATFQAYDAAYGTTTLAHPAGAILLASRITQSSEQLRVVVKATDVVLAKDAPQQTSLRTQLCGRIVAIDRDGDALAFVTLELAGGDTLIAAVTRLAVDELRLMVGEAAVALVKSVAIDERSI